MIAMVKVIRAVSILTNWAMKPCWVFMKAAVADIRHHVTDICDGWGQGHDGMNYILASREAIANMVEIHASVVPYDAGILISSCDKSIPAHLIAAARLNLPLLHIPGVLCVRHRI